MLLCVATFGLSSCEKDGLNLSKTSYTLYSDDSTKIEGSYLDNIVWDSQNEFVATAEGNILTSILVGSTTLSCGDATISVTVKPRHTLYIEPYMKWGCSKSDIIAKFGTPDSETDTALGYATGNSAAPLVMYMFNSDKLTSCGVAVKMSYASELVDFIAERYVILEVDGTAATFVHCYGKVSDPKFDYGGQMDYSSSLGGFIVAYIPNSNETSNSNVTLGLDLEGTRGVEKTSTFNDLEKAIIDSNILK